MGFNRVGTKLLLHAKSQGVDFEKTITIGRQGIHTDADTLQKHLLRYGYTHVDSKQIISTDNGYADSLLKILGAREVHSIDASNYESATFIHDMNEPIPALLKKQYSVVIDGGSLEHIFNFPTAIKNCMEMVIEGGYFLGITPANNYFGHGFYQFSPELFFRIFTETNGFKIEKIYFYNDRSEANWYSVKDPDEVKKRVILSNNYPSNLFIMAKRISSINPFVVFPQQSDYQNILWVKNNSSAISVNQQKIPYYTKAVNYYKAIQSFFNEIGNGDKKHFIQVEK
jgi:hypothetical protein